MNKRISIVVAIVFFSLFANAADSIDGKKNRWREKDLDKFKDKATMEKCFELPETEQKNCAASNDAYTCAGREHTDFSEDNWKYVERGTCDQVGGRLDRPQKK